MRSSGRPVRVLLVDDQPLLRQGFRMILEAAGPDAQPVDAQAVGPPPGPPEDPIEVVGEAADGEEAVALAARCRPDVVLMDIRMPGTDGIEATRRIVSGGGARVLALTTFDLDEYVFGALRAGASGFLLKDVRPTELVAAIRTVAGGDAVVAPRATRRLLDEYAHLLSDRSAPAEEQLGVIDRLTDREKEVLAAVAEGLSNAEIAERLFVSETTVKSHVGRILSKLGLRDRVQAVVLAFETGFTPGPSRPPGSPAPH